LNIKSYWFYIESYVHINIKDNHVLLFNTLSGKTLEYKNKSKILKIIENLRDEKNNGIVELNESEIKNPEIRTFIGEVRDYFMGDIIGEKQGNGKNPFIFTPILNIQKDIEKMKEDPSRSLGEKIMSYLNGISFYINVECTLKCPICKSAYKQLKFCTKSEKSKNKKIEIETIKRILEEAKGSGLQKVNILGGNILLYEELDKLVEMLEAYDFEKIYYIHYLNIINSREKINIFEHKDTKIKVLVDFPINKSALKESIKLLGNIWIDNNILFTVTNEDEFEKAETIIKELGIIEKSEFKPFYNGRNIDFFKKYVFLEKEDIFEQKPSFKKIYGNEAINFIDFGELTIKNDGSVFANINNEKLGDAKKDTLYEIIYKEMDKGNSWRKTRGKVYPCKDCVFNLICPPISNYEYFIGRNNLCTIWEEN